MNIYYYKYKKYKKKYLNLSNQKGSGPIEYPIKYTENDLVNLITTAKEKNENYITIQPKKIHIDRAIYFNGTIYDSVLLLQDIIKEPNKFENSIDSKKFNDIFIKVIDHYHKEQQGKTDDTIEIFDNLTKIPGYYDIRDKFLKP